MKLNINSFSHLINETPNLDHPFFKIKRATNFKKKILIISGGSRNGNHLICSTLDNHSQIPYLPGEDRVLSEIFWHCLSNEKFFFQKIRKGNPYKFFASLSGVSRDKWKLLTDKKISKKYKKHWAGNHPQGFVPILEYPNQKSFNYNHDKYIEILKKNFSNFQINFEDIFKKYLDAFSRLIIDKSKKLKFDYIYANSGLRREIYYLCKKKYNVKVVVPIRKFETFYFSKIFGRYKSIEIQDHFIKEAWAHWKNKTIDYLILKKLFPKNIILVKFEDFSKKKSKVKHIKMLCKFLDINYEDNLKQNTYLGKTIKPNTSFEKTEIKKIAKMNKKSIPQEYFKIYKEVEKNCYLKK